LLSIKLIYLSTASNLSLIYLYLSMLLTNASFIILECLPFASFRASGDISRAFNGEDSVCMSGDGELFLRALFSGELADNSSSPEVA